MFDEPLAAATVYTAHHVKEKHVMCSQSASSLGSTQFVFNQNHRHSMQPSDEILKKLKKGSEFYFA